MATTTAPLLDITTLAQAQHVRIDGRAYPLRHPEALSLIQAKRIERAGPRIGGLLQQPELTEEEQREVSHLLEASCRDVLDAPNEVHVLLSDMHRLAIIETFSRLRLETTPQPTGATRRSRIGDKKSRAFSGSTAATQKAG